MHGQQNVKTLNLVLSKTRNTFSFYIQGSVNREYMPIIVQQDATIYSLFISVNRSTCFGWYLHPLSAAHVTVSTASGISKTVTATCREHDCTGTTVPVQSCSQQEMLWIQ